MRQRPTSNVQRSTLKHRASRFPWTLGVGRWTLNVEALLVCISAGLCGCVGSLPTYDWHGTDNALKIMADRAASVEDISATCQVTLTDPAGKSVTLDGALAARGDKLLRLRAWKFNQAVLDLTMNEQGLFIWTGEKVNEQKRELHLDHVAKAWTLLSGKLLLQRPAKVVDLGGDKFDLHYAAEQGGSVVVEVNRATLTPRKYLLLDQRPIVREVVTLDRYELVKGIPWAMRTTAEGSEGSVEVRLHEVDLHADLPEGAFTPPPGAVREP